MKTKNNQSRPAWNGEHRSAVYYSLLISLLVFQPDLRVYGQHVGIGEPFPQEKLHINGNLRVDGDTVMGDRSSPATVLHFLSNGSVSLKLDANDDGSERFTIKKSGPDLSSVVFEVSEGGNTKAVGYGDFNGYGRFNGDFTLDGDSRKFFIGENFDVVADGSVEFYLDANADNTSADFAILNDLGGFLFLVEEDRNPTVYPFGALTGQTGGIRFRELSASGSNFIGLRSPDAISSNVWFTLPTTDGLPGQILQTDGSGILSWVNPLLLMSPLPEMRAAESGKIRAERPLIRQDLNVANGDSLLTILEGKGPCFLAGQDLRQNSGPNRTLCLILPPDPAGIAGTGTPLVLTPPRFLLTPAWRLLGICQGACQRLRCQAMCRS